MRRAAGQPCAMPFFVGPALPPPQILWPGPTKTNDPPVAKNNDAPARDRLRALLLRYKEEYDREWREQIELEEWREAEHFRKGHDGPPPTRDDLEQEMDRAVERKIRNDRVLRYLDDLPQIGRPPKIEEYRKHKLEARRAFPDDQAAAKKRFRSLSKLKPDTARNVWRILERKDKNKSAR